MIRFSVALALAMAALTLPAVSQTPTKVPRYTDDQKPHEWYVEQARLWQHETERTPKNADAWLNYYRAVRYIGVTGRDIDWTKQKERVDALVAAMEREVPNTFEYHYVRWASGGNDLSLAHHLERAHELRPDYAQISADLISFHELRTEHDKALEYARKWYESRALSPALLEYTRNVLASLEPNAVIITAGDLDTYPIWILQAARGLRPDVTVVNSSLVMHDEYREWVLDGKGIEGDASLLEWDRYATVPVPQAQAEFIRSIATNTTERPVYVALSVSPEQVKLIEKDLYVVGLANRYSPKRIDNLALLQRTWRTFRLDYLDGLAYDETYGFDRTWMPQMNLNYVTPALLLLEHCSTAGRSAEAQAYRDLLLKIGRAAGREKELAEHIAEIEGTNRVSSAPMPDDEVAEKEESAFSRSVRLYPNPASREVRIELPKATAASLRIVALDGSVVRELTTSTASTTVDLAGIPAGGYLLKVTTAEGVATKRFEVQR
jgi:hypothetical protein